MAGADVLVCQLEIPVATVADAARAARAGGTRVVLNAAPARELPDELLDLVDLLVVNEVEAQAITGPGELDMTRCVAGGARGSCSPWAAAGAWYARPGRPRRDSVPPFSRHGRRHHGGR